jgi:hypothetical protein
MTRKKPVRPKKTIKAITVTRETRADMAATWVRQLAREVAHEEILKIVAPFRLEFNQTVEKLKKALAEVMTSQAVDRSELRNLVKRAGDFTGMSESEVTRLVTARVTARVTRRTIDQMFGSVLAQFYGSPDHHGFRTRFGLDDPKMREYFERRNEEDDLHPGSD